MTREQHETMVIVSMILFLGRSHEVAVGFVKWDDEDTRYFDTEGRERPRPWRFHVFKEIGSFRKTGDERIEAAHLRELIRRGHEYMPLVPNALPASFYT